MVAAHVLRAPHLRQYTNVGPGGCIMQRAQARTSACQWHLCLFLKGAPTAVAGW